MTKPKKTTKKHNGGRPTKMTTDIVKKLEDAFCVGATDAMACFYAGISRQTLYNYQEKHPDFVDRKEALKKWMDMRALMNIRNRLESDEKGGYSLEYAKSKIAAFKNKSLKVDADLGVNDATREILDNLIGDEGKLWQR
jgi:hypothetical protein